MERQAIREIMRDVFGKNVTMIDIGAWVSVHCPLAPYTHQSGRDSKPSAGISVNDTNTSVFNCFTCGEPVPFHVMLKRYGEYSGEDLSALVEELEEEAYLGPRQMLSWEQLKERNSAPVLMPINEAIYMDLYDSAAGHPYLNERGISRKTAVKLELLFDPKDSVDNEPRILFPVRGPDGLLYGFSGRAIRKNAVLKVRDYHGLPKAQVVLGAHLVTQDNPQNIVLVEGLFDYANAHECGEYGCALMHSRMTDAQAEIVRGLSKPTYLFLDNPDLDDAGKKGVEVAGRLLKGYAPVMRVRYPKIQIEDDSEQGWHWLKDPGEMTPEEFQLMKEDAMLFM